MAQAEYRDVFNVPKEKLYSVITQYENYPKFVQGCQSVDVSRQSGGETRVVYSVSLMSKEVTYTLVHTEDPAEGKMNWSLIDSDFFKKNTGGWTIKELSPGKTEIVYSLEVEFKVPVPGFILNRLIKNSLPELVKSFEKKAREV